VTIQIAFVKTIGNSFHKKSAKQFCLLGRFFYVIIISAYGLFLFSGQLILKQLPASRTAR